MISGTSYVGSSNDIFVRSLLVEKRLKAAGEAAPLVSGAFLMSSFKSKNCSREASELSLADTEDGSPAENKAARSILKELVKKPGGCGLHCLLVLFLVVHGTDFALQSRSKLRPEIFGFNC